MLFTCSAIGLSSQTTDPGEKLLTARVGVVRLVGDTKIRTPYNFDPELQGKEFR